MRLGWTYPTYAAHESGWRTFPPKVAKKYAKTFGVSEEWLLFGKYPPSWYTSTEQEMVEVESPVRYMPLFTTEDATSIEQILKADIIRRDFCISDMGSLPPSCFAVRIINHEMENDLRIGDVLVFQASEEEAQPGGLVILNVRRQSKPSIRRARLAANGIKYVAANENYEPLEPGEARIFGRAVMHIRPF
jgi:SOS-response transcriptional repressor LexA